MTDNPGRKTTLDQYADGEPVESFGKPPHVVLNRSYTTSYTVPDDPSKLAGHTGIDYQRGRVFISPRTRSRHYFEKYDGYAMETKVLARAQSDGVEYVMVHELDRNRTYVWLITDFLAADPVNPRWSEGGEQKALATSQAIGIWDQPDPREDRR